MAARPHDLPLRPASGCWRPDLDRGTLYPLLARLRRGGLVQTSWRESPAGPPRRYYRLTNDGRRALEEFNVEWGRYRDAVDQLVGADRSSR